MPDSARQGPVLDYASPRVQGKVRLPSNSHIEMRLERDEIVIDEWLAAKGGAIIALGMAAVTLVLLPILGVQSIPPNSRLGLGRSDVLIQLGVIAVVWLSEMIVMLLVINNTWRRTMLEGRRDGLLLKFTSPFGNRRHEWNASDIEEIRIEITTRPTDRNQLGELQIHIAGQPVAKLFTDHATLELNPIATHLRNALGVQPRPEPSQG